MYCMHDASAQKVAREALRLLNWPTKQTKEHKKEGGRDRWEQTITCTVQVQTQSLINVQYV